MKRMPPAILLCYFMASANTPVDLFMNIIHFAMRHWGLIVLMIIAVVVNEILNWIPKRPSFPFMKM
jgi:hypothetical protein